MTKKIFNKCKNIHFLTTIHTTRKNGEFKFIGIRDKREGHEAILYTIPNNNNPNRPHIKGIQKNELESAWTQLYVTGELTKAWFNDNLQDCNNEGGCNFSAIRGIVNTIYPNKFKIGHGKITGI